MDSSVRLGRIAGVEVGLHWSLAFVFVFIVWSLAGQILPAVVPDQPQSAYWLVSSLAAFLFYASLLSHEMGHALVARRLGVKVDGITLWIFGGVARLRGDAASPSAEAKIAIAGPIVSLVLAIVFGGITFALDATAGPPLRRAEDLALAGEIGADARPGQRTGLHADRHRSEWTDHRPDIGSVVRIPASWWRCPLSLAGRAALRSSRGAAGHDPGKA